MPRIESNRIESDPMRKVAGVSAGQYVRLFEWDYSKFAVRQRLPALVALIQGSVGKIEEEHRNLSMVFSEKNQAMQVSLSTLGFLRVG